MKHHLKTLLVTFAIAGLAFGEAAIFGNIFKLHALDESLFPASSTTITGGLLFGTDAGDVYVNNGTKWVSTHVAGAHPVTVATSSSTPVNQPQAHFIVHSIPPTFPVIELDSAVVTTAGTGAGTITFAVYDETALAVVASVTIACAALEGSVTAGTTGTSLNGHALDVRITAEACALRPHVNITINVTYSQ